MAPSPQPPPDPPPPPDTPIYRGPAHEPAPPTAREQEREHRHRRAREIGRRIRDVRKERGLSQTELTHMIGRTHRNWLSAAERGEHMVSSELLSLIANALDVTTDYLLHGTPPPERRPAPPTD